MAESDLKVNRCQWWWRTQQVAPLLVEMSQPGQNILCMVREKLTGLGGRCTRAARRGYSARRVLGSCCPVQLARALGLVVSSLIQFMAPYHTNGLIAEVNHRDQAWISP